jgi:integrase/recombinase XerC
VSDIERFLSYLRLEKRFSEHTTVAYRNDLEQFRKYLAEQYQLEDLAVANHFYIRSWVVSLIENKIEARSVSRKITTLRSFYRFLMRIQRIQNSPMLKVIAPKVPKKLPEYLDEQKMQILTDPNQEEHSFDEARNNLLIDFFYRTGVRRSELINLKIQDVNLYNLTITVTGKRNKMRQIPITNKFKNLINQYLQLRKNYLDEINQNSEYFFIGNKGNKMYDQLVYRIVKTKINEVSSGKKKSPHILRHTFATTMLNHGADINAIKELLGHSSLSATQVYTHNSIEKLKEIYKQAFPKA